jgi:hypothetical protein
MWPRVQLQPLKEKERKAKPNSDRKGNISTNGKNFFETDLLKEKSVLKRERESHRT